MLAQIMSPLKLCTTFQEAVFAIRFQSRKDDNKFWCPSKSSCLLCNERVTVTKTISGWADFKCRVQDKKKAKQHLYDISELSLRRWNQRKKFRFKWHVNHWLLAPLSGLRVDMIREKCIISNISYDTFFFRTELGNIWFKWACKGLDFHLER